MKAEVLHFHTAVCSDLTLEAYRPFHLCKDYIQVLIDKRQEGGKNQWKTMEVFFPIITHCFDPNPNPLTNQAISHCQSPDPSSRHGCKRGSKHSQCVCVGGDSRKGNIWYVVCFQRLLENKLLLKVEMFTSIENCFMPLTGNYFTASQAVALSSGYVSLTPPNNLAFTFS